MMATVSHVEASIFSDVLSWVGLGGTEKEEAADDIGSGEVVAEDVEPEQVDEGGSIDDVEEVLDESSEETEEEATDGRAEEL